jgi:hypothetical protein
MGKTRRIAVYAVVAVVLIFLAYALFSSYSKPGSYDSFAQCLTDNGAAMYGTSWCKFCNKQKEMFGKSFKYVNFIDCDANKALCLTENIKSYPTWIINGTNYVGKKPLNYLASLTNCSLS